MFFAQRSVILNKSAHRFVWGRFVEAKRMFAIKILRNKEYDPQYAFVDACGKGDKAAMKSLLDKYHDKININARSGKAGNTGLHAACAGGHVNIVQGHDSNQLAGSDE